MSAPSHADAAATAGWLIADALRNREMEGSPEHRAKWNSRVDDLARFIEENTTAQAMLTIMWLADLAGAAISQSTPSFTAEQRIDVTLGALTSAVQILQAKGI